MDSLPEIILGSRAQNKLIQTVCPKFPTLRNFNKIAPFGKEDTAKELQDHAAKTQDTLVDAVENAEVAEIKRAVFRALTRLRAATIKEFDTIVSIKLCIPGSKSQTKHFYYRVFILH